MTFWMDITIIAVVLYEWFLPMQTLAYLLPVLTLALQKAEAEFEDLAKVGKAHTAGNSCC